VSTDRVELAGTYTVAKAVEPAQNVFGWFSVGAVASGEPVIDIDDDIIPPEELERASWDFVKSARMSGEEHDGGTKDGHLVASIVFTDDMLDALSIDPGTGEVNEPLRKALREHMPRGWFGGFHLPDAEAYQRAKAEKTEFSIEGYATVIEEVT
jgi:hypothetical protein